MKRMTTQEFVERLGSTNPLIEVLGEYINQRTKILVKGRECGHEWMGNPYDLLSGHGCPQCRYINNSNRSKKTNEQFVAELKNKNPNIEPLDEYVSSQKHILVRCRICGYEWNVQPNSLLNGSGCANCAGLKRKSTVEFVEELKRVNSTIEVLGEYAGNRSRVNVQCRKCGHEWNPTAKSLLIGRGCPECTKAGTSFMEQFILAAFQMMLGEASVINRDRETLGIELDIYIPSKNIAIEPGSWYWHKTTITSDMVKRQKGHEAGIRVITIYDTFPSSEKEPFDKDCFVFEGQLNEPGYVRIKQLTIDLLEIIGISLNPTEEFWNDVIERAHMGTAKISHDEYVEALFNVSPYIEVLGKYQSEKTKIRVKCNRCGHTWEPEAGRLLKGSGCVSCAGLKKRTTKEFIADLATLKPSIEVMGEYINSGTKIKVRDITCGHSWEASPNSLLRGSGCPQCAGNTRKSQQQFVEEMYSVNPDITVIGKYLNAHTKIEVRCNICKREFAMTPNSLLCGHGCKECNLVKGNKHKTGKTHRKTTAEFISILAIKNPAVEVLGEYSYSKNPVTVRCKECGHEWTPQAGSLLRGHGCPVCGRTKANRNRLK